jgi:hypothetical protein
MSEHNQDHEARITALQANVDGLIRGCAALPGPIHNLQLKTDSVFLMINAMADGIVHIQTAQTVLAKYAAGPDCPGHVRDAIAKMERYGELLEKHQADFRKVFADPEPPAGS